MWLAPRSPGPCAQEPVVPPGYSRGGDAPLLEGQSAGVRTAPAPKRRRPLASRTKVDALRIVPVLSGGKAYSHFRVGV